MEQKNISLARKIFRIIKWAFLVLIGLYILLVIGRLIYRHNEAKTAEQVDKIHNTKLTMADVMGENLPPDPGAEADKTVAGIDANQNGIRDDVELAIFKEYPNSAKTRAVLLQYALALQMEVTQPMVNTTTVTEIVREQSRGFQCVGSILPNRGSDESFNKLNSFINFVKNKQLNTEERKKERDFFVGNVRSYEDLENNYCDIDISKLPN